MFQAGSEDESPEAETNKLSLRMRRETVAAAGDQEEVRSQSPVGPRQNHEGTRGRLVTKS